MIKLSKKRRDMPKPNFGRVLGRMSFSEHGEDVVMRNFLQRLYNVHDPVRYLDIGSWHPVAASNTYLFYTNGGNGVLVEPNPFFKEITEIIRSEDIFYNVGIQFDDRNECIYYDFGERPALNTFITELGENIGQIRKNEGVKLKQKIKLSLMDINEIINNHFNDGACDVLSIDCEEADTPILKTADFNHFTPKLICVEHRDPDTDIFLKQYGYEIAFGTLGNTIYANTRIMKNPHLFRPFPYVDEFYKEIALKKRDSFQHCLKSLFSSWDYANEIFSKMVDNEYYYETYKDVAEAKVDAGWHYFIYGWREGRNPAPWFNTSDYLAENPELKEKGVNPFAHFLINHIDELNFNI